MISKPSNTVLTRGLFLVVTLLFAVSAGIRLARFDPGNNLRNLDASYHVLLTVEALRETPARIHYFLPLVSLGKPADKHIGWGVTVPDAHGNYYYTSFPPLGFLIPYVVFAAFDAAPTLQNLLYLNLGIHYAAVLLLCLLVWRALPATENGRRRWLLTALVAATYLFAFEALYSHGVIYWHHSPFQVVWLVQLLAFQRLLGPTRRSEDMLIYALPGINQLARIYQRFPKASSLLLAVSFAAPLMEWTGYLSNAALAWLLWHVRDKVADGRQARWLARAIPLVTLAAGLSFILHFCVVIGLEPLLHALGDRYTANNTFADVPVKFLYGYLESYGLLFILVVTIVVALPFASRRIVASSPLGWSSTYIVLSLAAILPLFENFLLLQHAIAYSFDRLKALVPMALLLAGYASVASAAMRRALISLWVVAIAGNIALLGWGHREWNISKELDRNTQLLNAITAATTTDTVYACKGVVRGWVNLTLKRGVFGTVKDVASLQTLTDRLGVSEGVLLHGRDIGNSIYAWDSASIYRRDTGEVVEISYRDITRPRINSRHPLDVD